MIDDNWLIEGEAFTKTMPYSLVKGVDPEAPESLGWKPGAWGDWVDEGYKECHGLGFITYEIVSVHQPKGYPTRVFYTVSYENPDHEKYRKPGLKICIKSKFKRLVSSFPFRYEVVPLNPPKAAK